MRSETIGGRLKEVRGDMSQAVFAAKLGIDKSLLGKYERNQSVPGGELLAHLNRITGVNINWLLTGSGMMFDGQTKEMMEQLDPELVAIIITGISKVYGEANARISLADMGRLMTRLLGDAMAFGDKDQRPAFVAGELAALRRELLRPITPGEAREVKHSA